MAKCTASSGCANDAIGVIVHLYHDFSVFYVDAACDEHSYVPSTPPVYDEYGSPVYRPDPIFMPDVALSNAPHDVVYRIVHGLQDD